jgi:hypothetical protein
LQYLQQQHFQPGHVFVANKNCRHDSWSARGNSTVNLIKFKVMIKLAAKGQSTGAYAYTGVHFGIL